MSEDPYRIPRESESGILIVVVLILLLLGAIAGGAYWIMGQRRQAAMHAEIQAMETERAAHQAASKAAAQQNSKAP
jgi:uncharacterized protein HemX